MEIIKKYELLSKSEFFSDDKYRRNRIGDMVWTTTGLWYISDEDWIVYDKELGKVAHLFTAEELKNWGYEYAQ